MPKSPEKPGDLNMQNLKYLRFVDPEDSTKIIQIALVDTGVTTGDGTPIYSVGIAAGGGSPIPTTSVRPNAGTPGQLTMNGSPVTLPATTDAMYVWLQAPDSNNGPIGICGAYAALQPGESVVIDTDEDASWITGTGINPDRLNYLILRRT